MLLADSGLELVTASRVPLAPRSASDRLPAEAAETARWWARHLIEVITGVPLGTRSRPDNDPVRRRWPPLLSPTPSRFRPS